MATLARQHDPFEDDSRGNHPELTFSIPKPFPSRAEREQEELLESLEEEVLNLDEVEASTTKQSLQVEFAARNRAQEMSGTRQRSEDLLPSISHVQTSCLTTLNDLLSTRSANWAPIVPDRRHSLPPSSLAATTSLASSSLAQPTSALQKLVRNLRAQQNATGAPELNALAEEDLLKELQQRVRHAGVNLPSRDAELARTLVSLLAHLQHASSSHPMPTTFSQGRVASWSDLSNPPPSSQQSSSDPFASLKRQVSDFRLERSWVKSHSFSGEASAFTSTKDLESAALWTKIDEELGAVLSLSHWQPDSELPPPEYDPGDYEGHHGADNLPKYEPSSAEQGQVKMLDSYKDGVRLHETTTRASEYSLRRPSISEKMKMDLEAVTLAIDRLYMVAPQLHNQRVELKKSKVEELERAKRMGKGKQREFSADDDARELGMLVDLVTKAADRKMVDQAVVLNESLKDKLNKAQREDDRKRAAFVEQLARHSDAGRLHSQDAVFMPPSSRTQNSGKTLDPCALLSLPEFIREGVPEEIVEEMEFRRDAEALLTLPEFIKRYPQPELMRPPSSTDTHMRPNLSEPDFSTPPPAVRPAKNRSRSMSEPLSWLLSGSNSRSSSPIGGSTSTSRKYKSKLNRPRSSNGSVPTVHEGLDVSYVAEYHESLQHVLGFFAVSGVPLDGEVEAEVVPSNIVDEHEVLVLRCGPNVSAPLPLPASVALGKADITSIGKHYQVKLRSNPFSSPSSSSQSDSQPEFLDAAHFQNMTPTSFICSSCSLPLAHVAQLSYRDLPSEHWAELVDAWMCHSDLKLHEHVKNGSKDGFWPGQGQVLVGGSYVLFREDVTVKGNLREAEVPAKSPFEDSTRMRCICGALLGRRQQHPAEAGCTVYRLDKYAFRPMSPSVEPIRVPLSAFIVEDMNEYVHAHATYRFVIADEEEERPRILVWLFKPNMRLAYTTPAQYVISKCGSIRAAKVLFKILGPTTAAELPGILNKYPGFPQAEHLYYPRDICRRLSAILKESNTAYPESMRTMTGLDVGWLQRA